MKSSIREIASLSTQKLEKLSLLQLLWTLGGLLVARQIASGFSGLRTSRSMHDAALKVFHVKSSPDHTPDILVPPIDRDHLIVRRKVVVSFPESCNDEKLRYQAYQLPDFRCIKTEKRIWNAHCSYSYATRCPDPQWLKPPTTAVLVDVCGQAQSRPMLRLLGRMTSDAPFNTTVEAWPLATKDYKENTSDSKGQCLIYPISAKVLPADPNPNATIHCISTAAEDFETQELTQAVNKLPESLKSYFHIAPHQTKVEKYLVGLKAPVDFLRLGLSPATPEFIHKHGSLLSSNVKYFEFVNTHSGEWENWFLSDLVDILKKHRFVCYFAGSHGNLWRLTDCFLDHFDLRFWANVACVNIDLEPKLLERMELMYQATLARKYEVKFMNERFIGTDGNRNAIF